MSPYALIGEPPWQEVYWLGWAVAVIIAVVSGMAIRRLRNALSLPLPAPESVTEENAETTLPQQTEPATAESGREGPGPILARFQALRVELDQATQEMHRFSGTREALLQGWQQLATDIIRRVLPVLENLQPYLEDKDSSVSEVAQMAYGRLLTELVTVGVMQIIPQAGDPFDAKYHLLSAVKSGSPPYQIKEVVAPGFLFRPRVQGEAEMVIKPAEVIVVESTEITRHTDARAETIIGNSEKA